MAITFQNAERMFARKRSFNNWKLVNNHFMLVMLDDDTFGVYSTKWEHSQGRRTKRVFGNLLFTLDRNDVLTTKRSFDNEIWLRNLLGDWVGAHCYGDVRGSRERYKNNTFVRPYGGSLTVPLTEGMKINVSTKEILAHDADVKYVVNRKRAKPLRAYALKVLKAMETLIRLDVLNKDFKYEPCAEDVTYSHGPGNTATYRSYRSHLALPATKHLPLTDENLCEIASATFVRAKDRTTSAPVFTSWQYDKETKQYRTINIPPAQAMDTWIAKLRKAGERVLIHHLYKTHGAYDERVLLPAKGELSST